MTEPTDHDGPPTHRRRLVGRVLSTLFACLLLLAAWRGWSAGATQVSLETLWVFCAR